MAPPAPSLDYWRGFFRGAGASILDAIEAGILVAAADSPGDLRARRDAIAERLFTALLPPPPEPTPAPAQLLLLPEGAGSVPSLCSSDRAEAITDDTLRHGDTDDRVVAEAFRIKDALMNNQEQSEAALLDLLRRLQELQFTVDTLKVTEIGKAVNGLRKHSSKQIRHLVRLLIAGWKAIVDEWVDTKAAIVDHTPQSGLEEEEGGLPSPPMDEGALFATPTTSIQLSEFFDGMDDDGNIVNGRKFDKQEAAGRRHPANQESVTKQQQRPPLGQRYDSEQTWRQDQSMIRQSRPQEPFNGQARQQFITGTQGKSSNTESGPGRPQKLPSEPKVSDMRPKKQQDQRRTQATPSEKPAGHHDVNSVRAKLEIAKNAKLEATKRKLQEGYQEADNAKKQRTIQMVDPQDIPKQANRSWQSNAKARNNGARNWPSMRH